MRLPRFRLTVRRMMVLVVALALACFACEVIERRKARVLDAKGGRYLVLVKSYRGPSARSEANELRQRHGFPSDILAAGTMLRQME